MRKKNINKSKHTSKLNHKTLRKLIKVRKQNHTSLISSHYKNYHNIYKFNMHFFDSQRSNNQLYNYTKCI